MAPHSKVLMHKFQENKDLYILQNASVTIIWFNDSYLLTVGENVFVFVRIVANGKMTGNGKAISGHHIFFSSDT